MSKTLMSASFFACNKETAIASPFPLIRKQRFSIHIAKEENAHIIIKICTESLTT